MTESKHYDVVGIGNAIVDVLASAEDIFLAEQGLHKASMALIDEERAEGLYQMMGPGTECSGGSAANTLAGLASLGGSAAFIGKVRDDQLGTIFRHDMRAVGVDFDTPAATSGPATARCLIFVTPDAQRTMNTFLGACTQVSQEDIDEQLIARAQVTYIEGYLWDAPAAKSAIRKALAAARASGRKLAFSLSDVFCVDRHRDEFLDLVQNHLDIVFANENELKSLYQTEDFAKAAKKIQGTCDVAVITRSEKGCVVVTREAIENVPGEKVAELVDTTGAGDLFASGFLYGFTRGWDLVACAKLGNRCAAEIIQQMGARSAESLGKLVAAA